MSFSYIPLATQSSKLVLAHIAQLIRACRHDDFDKPPSQPEDIVGVIFSLIYGVLFINMGYIFGIAVPTLMMVEDVSRPDGPNVASEGKGPHTVDNMDEVVTPKTSSVLDARQHLAHIHDRSIAYMPGLLWTTAYLGTSEFLQQTLTTFFRTEHITQLCIRLLVSISLIELRWRWTREIIIHPAPKSPVTQHGWKRRWQALALPTALYTATAPALTAMAASLNEKIWGSQPLAFPVLGPLDGPVLLRVGSLAVIWTVLCAILVIPLSVLLARLEMGLLDPDPATIVEAQRFELGGGSKRTMYEESLAPVVWAVRTIQWRTIGKVLVVYAKVAVPLAFLFGGAICS